MNIGDISLANNLVLAPLAGITDLPFRLIARACGAGLVYSEMISAKGLVYMNHSTRAILSTVAEDRPVAFQLFGSDPVFMAEAAKILDGLEIDIIDINMGCPVRKVVKRGAGSALLKDLLLAEKIIRAVVMNTRLPVTVKIRSGWDANSIVAVEAAGMAESAGAASVIVHGRTSRQMFAGTVDLHVIRQVKEAVSIPVIGNGDVTSPGDIEHMMSETGCDGVMIGRGSLGNPWIFSPAGGPESVEERQGFLLQHICLMERFLAPREALFKARKHAGWYAKGLRGCSGFRKRLYDAHSLQDLKNLIYDFFTGEVHESVAGYAGRRIHASLESQESTAVS